MRSRRGLFVLALVLGVVGASSAATPVGRLSLFKHGLSSAAVPTDVAAGPAGSVWFTDARNRHPAIGAISTHGMIREFTAGLASDGNPYAIARGADGAMWFTVVGSGAGAIGRITGSGHVTEYSAGLNPDHALGGIARGPDGAMWFADGSFAIGRITRSGQISEFSAGLRSGSSPAFIARGPDGSMWFTDQGCVVTGGYCGIGRITMRGTIKEFTPFSANEPPFDIARGSDGEMWFTSHGVVGRITRTGKITIFHTQATNGRVIVGSEPTFLAPGPSGWMWVDDSSCVPGGSPLGSQVCAVGRFRPSHAHRIALQWFYRGLGTHWRPQGLAEGTDHNMWFTALGVSRSALGRITAAQR